MFDFLVKLKINSAFKNNARKHAFHNMESMKDILILFSYTDWPEIESISKDLEDKGKNVALWTIKPSQKNLNNIIFPSNVKVINAKEISFSKILSSTVLEEYKALSYETLIDLTTTKNKVFKYLLVNTSAEFSIGISEPEYQIYDFIMLRDDSNTLQETYNQIKFYLNNIR